MLLSQALRQRLHNLSYHPFFSVFPDEGVYIKPRKDSTKGQKRLVMCTEL